MGGIEWEGVGASYMGCGGVGGMVCDGACYVQYGSVGGVVWDGRFKCGV